MWPQLVVELTLVLAAVGIPAKALHQALCQVPFALVRVAAVEQPQDAAPSPRPCHHLARVLVNRPQRACFVEDPAPLGDAVRPLPAIAATIWALGESLTMPLAVLPGTAVPHLGRGNGRGELSLPMEAARHPLPSICVAIREPTRSTPGRQPVEELANVYHSLSSRRAHRLSRLFDDGHAKTGEQPALEYAKSAPHSLATQLSRHHKRRRTQGFNDVTGHLAYEMEPQTRPSAQVVSKVTFIYLTRRQSQRPVAMHSRAIVKLQPRTTQLRKRRA
mmetsp:Transcript_11944/g.27279  ORF Transcript_11944/g.27279 Transcript_11944/m.27279 type:complete len:275 (-) Transcript_11944:450-1274(-)